MLSWVRLRGINAHSFSLPVHKLDGPKLHCVVNKHQNVSSLSTAISQKVGSLRTWTGAL